MTRLLFWIALVILVVMAVRSKVRAAMTRAQGPAAGPAPGPAGGEAKAWRRVADKPEAMACCAHCGIYFPSSEAVRADGRDYCGTAHAREAHPQAR
ncbi:PP0621 family protein [Massilia luteola]|uniref:PP0621 family protein n=1 Tax=Massilia luteola TaxID=3081751 RepID=UPI002ACBDBB6|nr:PP0621 family protein [Massilia sp. Gc5]